MKYILLLLFPIITNASTITVVNNTSGTIRIKELRNKCTGFVITDKNPVTIYKQYVVNTTTAIHTYTICGAGYCSNSAIGMLPNKNYILNVGVDETGLIDIKAVSDDWPGVIECPKK